MRGDVMGGISLLPVTGIGEIRGGDDLSAMILEAFPSFEAGDVLVVSSKAVSKAEGRAVHETTLSPSPFARHLSELTGNTPAYCELVLQESDGILRCAKGVVICRTHHGFVLANAGVDASNAGGAGMLIPLPKDPDASARRLAESLGEATGKPVGVVVSDTFGRAWRNGQMDLAIGVYGIPALYDYAGQPDDDGRILRKTCSAVADELAAAAELVAGKTGRVPAVVVRGFNLPGKTGTAADLVMDPARDLFP